MHPAYSVILFTTASGAGYGLLALMGFVGLNHGEASTLAFGLTCWIVAMGLITTGLLASTLHLGHPERAWRALSQWRSSWLSREGIGAIVTYVPALLFGIVWSGVVHIPSLIASLGLITTICCAATVFCTGKIYSSLMTIRAWSQPLTVPVYLAFSLATGAGLLAAIAALFDRFQTFLGLFTAVSIIVVAGLKVLYWRAIDAAPAISDMGAATGLGRFGKVRQWELPHTSINFVQKEMGYVVARRHAQKLRRIVLWCFAAALISMLLALVFSYLALLTAFALLLAAVFERWLFFAEAKHVAIVYYSNNTARGASAA